MVSGHADYLRLSGLFAVDEGADGGAAEADEPLFFKLKAQTLHEACQIRLQEAVAVTVFEGVDAGVEQGAHHGVGGKFHAATTIYYTGGRVIPRDEG